MNDDMWARVALVTRLVWKAPQQTLGRTALMKLLFLLTSVREVLVGYRFRMYTYGPFDAEVLADIDYAARLQGVSVDMETYPNGYGYIIRPGAAAEKIMEHGRQFVDEHEADIEWVVENYASLSASALERISTIVYLDREGLVKSFGELALAVNGIKPRFDLATIEEDARRLQDAGLLVSCD